MLLRLILNYLNEKFLFGVFHIFWIQDQIFFQKRLLCLISQLDLTEKETVLTSNYSNNMWIFLNMWTFGVRNMNDQWWVNLSSYTCIIPRGLFYFDKLLHSHDLLVFNDAFCRNIFVKIMINIPMRSNRVILVVVIKIVFWLRMLNKRIIEDQLIISITLLCL